MRIGVFAVLCCTLLFALFLGHVPSLRASDDPRAVPARDLAGAQDKNGTDRQQNESDGSGGTASDTGAVNDQAVVPVQMPPLLIGQHGGEMVMIASADSGDVISVVTLSPGLDAPLQPAQQLESTIDLGIGVNARLTLDFDSGIFSFSFVP